MKKTVYKIQTTKMKGYICINCIYLEMQNGYSERTGKTIQELSFWCNHPKHFGVRKYVKRNIKKCGLKQTNTLLDFDIK